MSVLIFRHATSRSDREISSAGIISFADMHLTVRIGTQFVSGSGIYEKLTLACKVDKVSRRALR